MKIRKWSWLAAWFVIFFLPLTPLAWAVEDQLATTNAGARGEQRLDAVLGAADSSTLELADQPGSREPTPEEVAAAQSFVESYGWRLGLVVLLLEGMVLVLLVQKWRRH